MEKAELRIIKFDSSDVIATSVPVPPNPYANEDITNLNLFYFYGIGNDSKDPTGEDLLIRNGGKDVTDKIRDKVFPDGKVYTLYGTEPSFPIGVNTFDNINSKEYWGSKGITDGAYTLESYFFNLFNVFKRTE